MMPPVHALQGLLVSRSVGLSPFQDHVAAVLARLPRGGIGLLAAQDAYWSAVGLFALLAAGCEVRLPANLQAEALQTAATDCTVILSDQPRPGLAQSLILPGLPAADKAALPWLDTAAPITLFTSGSTGKAKAVRKTLGHLDREAAAIEALLGDLVPTGAAVHGMVPPLHAYGLAFHIAWPLATGRRIVGTLHEIWEGAFAALEAGDVLVTGPAHLRRMQCLPSLPSERRPSLALSAGGPLAEGFAVAAAAILGCPLVEILGSTEAGAIASRQPAAHRLAWQPLPGVQVTAAADGGMQLVSGHAADLDAASADRIRMVDAISQAFELIGRADNILKIEGKRVSPPQVEQALSATGLVAEAAVFMLNEQLAAAAKLTPEGEREYTALGGFRFGRLLRHRLATQLEPASLPRRWRFVANLPEDALGKRRLAALRALFENDMPGVPELIAIRDQHGSVELDLMITDDLPVLAGHFPTMPVVPGVAQLDWAMALAAQHLGLAIRSAQQFQVKFSNLLRPDTLVTLQLRHRTEARRLHFEYRAGDTIFSSGSIALDLP